MKQGVVSSEYLVVVAWKDERLVPHGCVTRQLAHSPYRVPHTTVLLVPCFSGSSDVLIARRSDKDIASGKWDFAGGHVAFEPAALSDSASLAASIERTAIREAREELLATIGGQPHIIVPEDIYRFSKPGELVADEPVNREYSTGFIVTFPKDAQVLMVDETRDGTMTPLDTHRLPRSEVDAMFRENPTQFADGASRVLAWGLFDKWPL